MRNSIKPANLGELMGEGYEHRTKLTLEDLPKLLGHKMPEISYDAVGRLRLHQAMEKRFGKDYLNMPHIQDLMKQHADVTEVHAKIRAMRRKRG